MPKPPLEELPKIADWKAPWEVDKDGKDIPADEQQLDAEKLKPYLHGLLSDKLRQRKTIDETTARKDELEGQIADLKSPDEFKELQTKLEQAQQAAKDAASGPALENLKLRIALRHNLTERQMNRLVGKTEDELDTDAKELLEELGIKSGDKDEKDDKTDDVRTTPRPRRFTNAGDPDPDAPKGHGKLPTPDEFADKFMRSL